MRVLALGEVLWDVYEDRSIIGGAPFNFSAHIAKLGADSYFLSSVGKDNLYAKTIESVKHFGIIDEMISVSDEFPTGTCMVTCDENGQPSYNITENSAFDNITIDSATIDKINSLKFNAFYFGTLSQRSKETSNSLLKILSECQFDEIICDLNLRPNCYNTESIENCLKYSTILKINREEYRALIECGFCCINKADFNEEADFYKSYCSDIAQKYNINIIIITLDKEGAVVYVKNDDDLYISEKPKNKAISTVGAGDGFSACFLYNYLCESKFNDCIERAILLSDFIVTRYEAIPEYTEELHSKIK